MPRSNIPEEVLLFCERTIGNIKNFIPASGGCINNGGKITTDFEEYFLKWNSAKKFPEMFPTEARGLEILAKTNCITIPKVISIYEGNEYACLLLEYIDIAPKRRDYWQKLAEGLARLHQQSSPTFGLDHDNYIGSLPQYNQPERDWISFFRERRLSPQIKMAFDLKKISKNDLSAFDKLLGQLPELLFNEKPALVHGDLWNGNLLTDAKGLPALIDPAVAFSHREMEIAFTQFFGGFDQEFYQVYQKILPLEKEYMTRFEIYNLYPLLVHVNLFGGSYYNSVRKVLSKFTN